MLGIDPLLDSLIDVMIKKALALTFFLVSCLSVMAQDTSTRQKHFNLKKGLAIQGYDPVSYHHGGPKKGNSKITTQRNGVTYRFASEGNKKKFLADPAKYEPAYGGWCAFAMIDGKKVKINPKTYKIIDGKTYLFYDGILGNTLKKWNAEKNDKGQVTKAGSKWTGLVGG